MPDPMRELNRLRELRGPKPPATPIAALLHPIRAEAGRRHRRLGRFIDVWQAHVPPELAARTVVRGFRGGVAHVTVDEAAARYELDRLLRSGLTQTLRRHYTGALVNVKLRLGSLDDAPAARG